MTPIERCSEKSQALAALGLAKTATTADIRQAFKRLVLEKHPDHGAGTAAEFSEINEAYHFLKENSEELGILDAPAPSRPVSRRPSVQSVETRFDDATLAECRALLSEGTEAAQHVATILHRTGRRLTYFVPTAPVSGQNDVVVPTGQLVDSRHAVPQVVSLDRKNLTAGVYHVPAKACDALFPGARSVQIRFAD